MESFNAKDLKKSFKEAKEKVPNNPNYNAIENIKKGDMEGVEEKKDGLKAWHLTNTGEKYVENGFKKEE